ncbi:MAG: hypothetical protein HC915_08680 [Anaerolineae bacterium]|nr:hypothetical protein [Anaerolineae bacterium]
MNPTQALYRLQTLEMSLDDAQQRVQTIEAEIKNDQQVLEHRRAYKECEKLLQQAQYLVNTRDLERQTLEARIQEGEQRLYGGSITTPKEMQDQQNDVEASKRRFEVLQTQMEEAHEQVRGAQAAFEEAQLAYESAKEAQLSNSQSMLAEREQLHNQMTRWLAERKDTVAFLKEAYPEGYKIYKKLKPLKNGMPIALLEGDACAVCRVDQNQTIIYQVRQHKAVVQCQNCGRILLDI